MLTGTADEAFGALTSGSTFTLQGTLKYTTTAANSDIGVPTSYVAADFRQDADGNVGLNTGTSNIRAKFDVIQNSNIPALVVDQYGTGDALQVKDGGVTKFFVNTNGITTLSGGVISNSGDGTINRNEFSEISASNMYLQLYKTGNRTSNTGPSIIFGGSYYPTANFPNAYAGIKGVATPYVSSSVDSHGGMLKFYVNDNTTNGASLEETDCRMVIDQYGNVGIGTTIPQAKLHVNGMLYAPGAVLQYIITTAQAEIGTISGTYISGGLSLTITPKFASSKILIKCSVCMGAGTNTTIRAGHRIVRNYPTADTVVVKHESLPQLNIGTPIQLNYTDTFDYIDTPNTTSAITYTNQYCRAFIHASNTYDGYIRMHVGGDIGVLILMEIA